MSVTKSAAGLAAPGFFGAREGRSETSLLVGQKRILELVATGASLDETLDELLRFLEAQEDGLRCGILVLGEEGEFFRRSFGPSLPETYHRALERAPVTPPYLDPCDEAAHLGVAVVTPDIAGDERWSQEWRTLAVSSGLRACRSTPIVASDGRVLASLAMYSGAAADPQPANPDLVDIATHLGGIAIGQAKSRQQSQEREELLQKELAASRRLQEISTVLAREGDAEALYQQLVDAAMTVMRSDMASMQMLDEARGQLRLLAWKELHPASAEFWQWVSADSESICGAALRTGGRIVVPDIEASLLVRDTGDFQEFRRSGVRAVQSTPLMSRGGRILGMISTHWRQPCQPSEQDLLSFDLLARQAADLIERVKNEQALRERTEQLEAVLETAPAGVWFTTDREVRSATGNRHAAEMFRAGEAANLSLTATHEEDRPALVICRDGKPLGPEELPLQRAARGEQVAEEELEFRYPDGFSMTVLLRASTLRDCAGEPAGAVAAAVDITARKQAENGLRESEERYRNLLNASNDVLYRHNPDWSEMRQLTGGGFLASTERPDPDWFAAYIPPDDQPQVWAAIQEAIRTKSAFELEHRVIRADGSLGWTMSRSIPVQNDKGEIFEWFGAASDVTARREAETALRESEERLRLILDSASEYAIISLDGGGRITSWNSGAERILGYGEDEIIGQPGDVFFTPEDRAAGAPEKEMTLARTEGRATNERWHMRKDGSRFWGSGVMLPLAGHESGFLKIFRDRTEEREAEERRHLLINELNHRVKNTLATVQSIASQTLKNSDAGPAVRDAFEARLISLSKTHDVLTRRNWEGARLSEIAAQSLRAFEGEGEPRIEVSGPEVRLSPKAALAISMALHELATNAVKYGALSSEAGRVRVRWQIARGGKLRIDWEETGGPRVEPPRRKGFGSRLIERSLAAELGGQVRVDYRRSGVTCRIEAPLTGVSG